MLEIILDNLFGLCVLNIEACFYRKTKKFDEVSVSYETHAVKAK